MTPSLHDLPVSWILTTLYLYPSSLQRTLTHLHAFEFCGSHARLRALLRYTSTETTRRRFYYSNLSTIRWCIEYRLFLSFFPHLLFYGSLFILIVKTLRESLCIPTLFVDGLSREKHKGIFPESLSPCPHAFLIQTNCAILEKLSSRRERTKLCEIKGSQKSVSREVFNVDFYFVTKAPQSILACRMISFFERKI